MYQGNKSDQSMRYYFGHGVIGKIAEDPEAPDYLFAEILASEKFRKPVPIW
jgi:hypothetical protein